MKLTRRDLMFLTDLYYVRYLNTKRIARLFGNYTVTIKRLKKLQNDSLIKNVDYNVGGEKIYCITKKGCGIINQNYFSISKTDKVNHFLTCADFYFYLRQRNYCIQRYLLDEQISFRHQGKFYKFRPDIVLQTDRWYFVEIDICNKRFEEKIRRWELYYNSFEFQQKFELFPPIIIISSDVNKIREVINKYKTIELNYAFKDLNDIQWIYSYEI